MKKNNLLKVIAITCLVFLVLTWIIPTGFYSGSTYTKDSISALGVGDLFIYSFSVFIYSYNWYDCNSFNRRIIWCIK